MIKSASQSSLTNDVKYSSMSAGAVPSNEYLIETVVLSNTATSVTFSNLSQYAGVYKHLSIVTTMRNTANAGTGGLSLRLNGDSASNYTYHLLQGDGSSAGSAAGTGQAQAAIGWVPHASVAPSAYSATSIELLDAFSSSKNKTLRSVSGSLAYSNLIGLWSAMWINTAAVSSISIHADSANSFATGCRFSLYGVTA